MRVLVIDEEAKAKVKAVRDFAEKSGNYYIVGKGGFSMQRPPGDDPRHVCKLADGFRCVFSMTVADGTLWRHFSVSVPGEKYPNPIAAFTLAGMFGFTGWDGKSEKPSEEWLIKISPEEHCIVIAEKEIKNPYGGVERPAPTKEPR
jgi:hypothetical protein